MLAAALATGCPDGTVDDAGVVGGGDGTIVIDGTETAYTIDQENSELLIVVEKALSATCPSFFHNHVFEAEAFGLSFDIDEADAAASSLTATVPAGRLVADAPAKRAKFDLTKDEEVPESFRGDIAVSGRGEIDADNHNTLTFKVLSLDGFAEGSDTDFPNTAEIEVDIAGEKSTVTMTYRYIKDGTSRTIVGGGVLDGTQHGMPRKTECYKAATLPLNLTLVLVPGSDATVVDAGDTTPFQETTFPYEGDCVNKTPWNTVRDVVVRNCAGCHAETPRHGATSSLVTYANLRTDTERNPGVPAFEAMRAYLLATDDHPQMPPVDQSPLSTADLATVIAWIDEGGPECNDGTTPTTFTAVTPSNCGPINYETAVGNYLENNCSFCHSATQTAIPALGVDTYASGSAAATHPFYKPLSVFEASLERMKDGTMPPYGGATQVTIDAFEAWVNAGYPEGACQ